MQLVLIVLMAIQVQGPGPTERIFVSCENGQLTIDVLDAPLATVLNLIGQRAGISINIPGDSGERVTRKIGPGPVISVLGSFLNETDYNYMIVDPGEGARLQATLYLKGSIIHTPPLMQAQQAALPNITGVPVTLPVTAAPARQRENLFVVSEARQVARQERLQMVRSNEKMRALEIERFQKLNSPPKTP